MRFLSSEKLGALYAVLSGLCYGLVGYFGISLVKANLSVTNMLFWRFFVATLFIGVLLIPQYKEFTRLNRQAFQAFIYGLLFYGVSTAIYFTASLYIGTGIAMVIFFTFPAGVMVINALFYKVMIKKIYYLSFGLIFIGMLCLITPDSLSVDMRGVALGLVCSFFYACYIAASKKITIPPLLSTFMISLGCMVTNFLFTAVDGSLQFPQTASIWFDIFCMGTLCSAIPILLLLQGFKYISSEKASLLSVLEPIFVVLFGILLLDERITLTEFFGITILLTGAAISLVGGPKEVVGTDKTIV